MVEPAKPFACTIQECGMTFTNEDHLHVHTKKHDMVLQFGMEQKAAFVADQTPTPTRFIRNCEEVGLFQDLQNVNPFDEGFKRAMESKQGIEGAITTGLSTDDLHTPQMFPLLDPGDSVFTTNQRNITISRSSNQDQNQTESGAVKEFETTTISKLTNEVTTISRIVEKNEEPPKNDDPKKDSIRKDISYRNNIIKILSNVEIRNEKPMITEDMVKKEVVKDYQLQVPPIMSQQSIDNVVESLTSDFTNEIKKEELKKDYEVILKLPSGQQIKLTSAEVEEKPKNTKDLLKKVLTDKVEMKNNLGPIVLPGVIPISGGTLIPVSLTGVSIVNNGSVLPKLPLKVYDKRPVKRKSDELSPTKHGESTSKEFKEQVDKESRKAASKRYRVKDKEAKQKLAQENNQLKRLNERLQQEKTSLKVLIMDHMKRCPNCDDFKNYIVNDS